MFVNIRQSVPHPKREVVFHEFFQINTCSGIRPEQNCDLLRLSSVSQHILHFFDNRQSLHCLILKERDCDLLSVSADAMCAFLKTVGVVSDHPAGSFDDALRRTVILCKLDHHSFRKIFLKIQHNLRLCTAKTIDRLVIIADDKQIVSRLCQKFDRLILDRIDILKFIDQNIAETFLPSPADIRSCF